MTISRTPTARAAGMRLLAAGACLLGAAAAVPPARAGVLPEERADAMYKVYDGGGLKAQGPSVLVRKNFGEQVSVAAGYDVDQVSGASIDMVVLGASPLKEERKQKNLSVDYLRGKTTYSAGVEQSKENDYDANTAFVSIAQDMFGDLTTVTLAASRGWDTVTKVGAPDFRQKLRRKTYSLGVSQIITRNLIAGLDYETITEQGYLQNPYRAIRYLSPDGRSYITAPEVYPGTRTSNAIALRAKYYLPWKASVGGKYRYFFDTWGIHASTAEIDYTQPFLHEALMADVNYRFYTQNAANFYADLFPRANYQNYMARDKELAGSQNQSVGVALTYDFLRGNGWRWLRKSSVSLHYDHIMYRFKDFRDATDRTLLPGTEPLYRFDANVAQALVSVWF
jgi:hypothetical protein